MFRGLIFLFLSCILSSSIAFGQDFKEITEEEEMEYYEETFDMIIQHFDELDRDWHGIEPTLNNYNGIHIYCSQESYKEIVWNILSKIHHYDTIIMNKINDPHYFIKEKERRKILKEIEKFEHEFNIPNFLKKLDHECEEREELEKEKKYSRKDFGEKSYDGQKQVVNQEIKNYMRHITHKIDHIDKYLHHLHITEIQE